MKKVGHKSPYLIVLFDTWYKKEDFEVVFVTELCSGGSLNDFLSSAGTLRLSVLKKVLRQTLEGLSVLHAHGAIHRDLKAENVYVQKATGDVRVGDYGLAAFSDEAADTGKALHGRTTVGTPCFMAPEVLISDTDRDAEYDEKVDIWSFGMMLVELVGGSQPYEECQGISELITKIQKGLPPVALQSHLHKGVKAVIDACLQFDPKSARQQRNYWKTPFFADKSTIAQDAKTTTADMVLVEEPPEERARRIIREAEAEAKQIISQEQGGKADTGRRHAAGQLLGACE